MFLGYTELSILETVNYGHASGHLASSLKAKTYNITHKN